MLVQMYYNTLLIEKDRPKDIFTLCFYDMQQGQVVAAQKMGADLYS